MEDYKVCSKCGATVKIEPVYQETGDVESGPEATIIDYKSLCECGHDVLEEECEFCKGEGCVHCVADPSKIV